MISAKSILAYLPIDDLEVDKAMEWVYQAFDKIGYRGTYQRVICQLTVENFKAMLPADLIKIELVVHIPEQYIEPSDRETPPALDPEYNYESIERIQHQGIINNYNLFSLLQANSISYTVLRYLDTPFGNGVHCTNCPNISTHCDLTYSITPNRCLLTNFETGTVCISYLTYSTNEQGDLLIPDDSDFKDAMASYIMMKYSEEKMWTKYENGMRFYELYLNKWVNQSTKVRTQFKLDNMATENIVAFLDRYNTLLKSPLINNRQPPIKV
jgi:hypothetical protein